MNMARSTFYKRPHAGHRAAREKADTDLRVRIEDILAEFPAYGYRRVTHELRRRGLVINHKRVARVMREHALTPHRVRAWLATTNSDHKQPIYPNLRSSITPEGPDELWVADLTYIRLTTGFVFLAVVLDAWSRRVIGYAISHLLDTRLCLAALDAALDLRQPRAGSLYQRILCVAQASPFGPIEGERRAVGGNQEEPQEKRRDVRCTEDPRRSSEGDGCEPEPGGSCDVRRGDPRRDTAEMDEDDGAR